MQQKNYFTYNNGDDITNGAFRISASQVSKFFDYTSTWYRENLLGESGFTGNTASVLGTVVHAAIEMHVKEKEIDQEAIEKYLADINNPEVDTNHILIQYPLMLDAIIPEVEKKLPDEVEKFVFYEILPGIGAGGSIDALVGNTIRDWKTTNSRYLPTKFPRAYWFQQMTYAWVLKQLGTTIRYLELVYVTQSDTGRVSEKTGKALKDYPSICSVLREEVTEENLQLIGSCLTLIAESVQMWNTTPELRHLLAQDMRLKPKPPARLFV